MTTLTYNIVYKGEILDGYVFEDVIMRLVKDFSLSREKAEQLLKAKQAIIKKNIDHATAKKYAMALKKAGLKVVLTPHTPTVSSKKPNPPMNEAQQSPHHEKAPEASALKAAKPPKKQKTDNPPPKTISAFMFHGTGTEYFKIWIVNIILSILTLGVYSAWAKVRRKQYFYGNTHLQNSSFEYLADPIKILKGRLIVFSFVIIYSLVSEFSPIVGGLLSLVLVMIFPWLIVRSLAFNARNSAYKNIRFGFNGSVKDAFKVFLLWPILVPFTLGAIFPYVYFRQMKFMVENTSYGKTAFSFNAEPREYYGLFFKALGPLIIGIVLVIGAGYIHPALSGLLGMILYLYFFAYFAVKYTNLLYNSMGVSAHQLKADQHPMEYFIIVITNSLGIALTLGIFYPWARVRTLRYKLDHLNLSVSGDVNNFIAQEQKQVSAVGDEFSDFFDMDIGL